MSILILNSVSHSRSPYEEFLRELNEDLILLTANKYQSGFPKEDYLYIESFEDYDENGYVDLRAMELYEKYPYHTVLSCYEFDVIRAAHLRETFQLPGQNLTSAWMYRDKFLMKDTVRKKGILTPAFRKINTPIDLIDFIQTHQFPVVIKPISSAGSQNTRVLKNRQDLVSFLSSPLPSDIMVESFIEGEIYHVDGIIVNGKVEFICTSKYLDALLNYKSESYTGGHLIHPTHPLSKRMVKLTKQVVQALDTPSNTTFHAEWFHTPNDEIVFCEIASRVGGGRINETIKYTFGVDLFQAHFQTQLGIPYHFPSAEDCMKVNTLTGRVLIMKKEGRLLSIPEDPPPSWVIHHEILAEPGDIIQSSIHCTDLLAGFIVQGTTEEELKEKLISVTEWFNHYTHWE